MIVVGIDTATRTGGISVIDDRGVLGLKVLGVEEGHSQNLLPALEQVMNDLDLTHHNIQGLAVTVGPGSFTGLRIGMATAKALGYAWQVPLRGISTLLAAAWTYRGLDVHVCSVIDARRDYFYTAFYDVSQWNDDSFSVATINMDGRGDRVEARLHLDEIQTRMKQVLDEGNDVCIVGEGARTLYDRISHRSGDWSRSHRSRLILSPYGGALEAVNTAVIGALEIKAGVVDDPFQLVPNYLRRSEAERKCKPNKPHKS